MSARGTARRRSRSVSVLMDEDYGAGDDVLKVSHRFSAMAVRRVVDRLSPEQEDVVRWIGFGGLLPLPLAGHTKLDRHFSAWLCNQLVTDTGVFLADGVGAQVPVTAHDVHEVLGVPHGERPVGRDGPAGERDAAAVRRALGLGPGAREPTLREAEAVLTGALGHERDAFVVAFVLFVVGHFLAPPASGRLGKVNSEVFHALANPTEVCLYNWAHYALEELRRCAARVRRQVADGAPEIVLPDASCSSRYQHRPS